MSLKKLATRSRIMLSQTNSNRVHLPISSYCIIPLYYHRRIYRTLVLFPFFLLRCSVVLSELFTGNCVPPDAIQRSSTSQSRVSHIYGRDFQSSRCSCNRINGSPLPPRCVLIQRSQKGQRLKNRLQNGGWLAGWPGQQQFHSPRPIQTRL